MNSWGIPNWLELEVRGRDKNCVYCGTKLLARIEAGGSRRAIATWEHIINDARIVTRENIALCCVSCNSSKGARLLSAWLQSPYCKRKGITEQSVAPIVRQALILALQSNAQQTTQERRAQENARAS